MEKVQATLEFSLHLKEFRYLIVQLSGYWQIKTSFEILTSIPHTVEARTFHNEDNVTNPASVEDSVFFSSEFTLDKNTRAARIDDIVIYTVNILLNESQIEETLNALESKMIFSLYYVESHKELNKDKSSKPACSKDMTLHFNLHRGIHGHTTIIFETFAELSVMVHGLLVVLQPPLKSFSKNNSVCQRFLPSQWTKAKIPTLESVIFGKNFKKKLAADGKSFVIEEKYLQHAYRFLSTLRSCLLLSYDGLYRYFTCISEMLPSSDKQELEKLDMKVWLSELSDKVMEVEDPNDLAEAINGTLIELSAQLLNLWGKFLQCALESEHEQTRKEEKFKKFFFSTDHLRQEAILYDDKIAQSHKQIHKEVKKAPKVECLECRDTDLISKSPPVVFEDRYIEPDAIDSSEDFVDCPEDFIEDFVDCSEDFIEDFVDCSEYCREEFMDYPEDFIDSSEDVKSAAKDITKDMRKILLYIYISALNCDKPSILKDDLFIVKRELMERISRFFSNNPSEEFTLSMELDNGSNEGISVDIKMRAANLLKPDPYAVITFEYGCFGGKTAVIGHLGNKDSTMDAYDSLTDQLMTQLTSLVKSNSLIISRIRLFQETSEKKRSWEQLTPTQNQSSSTGSEDNSNTKDGTHLIVCVHGMGGSPIDFTLLRPYIKYGMTHEKIDFLMSIFNQNISHANIDHLASGLLYEMLLYITTRKLIVSRISFVGFSLGTLVIRTALSKPEFEGYLGNLHTYLSFGGPHMGVLYHRSFLFKIGLWLVKWINIGSSLSEMAFLDHKDPRERFLYKLSQKPGLEYFKNVILVSSLQDDIVPHHSARIEMCKEALKGDELGTVYSEMVRNTLEPVLNNNNCNFVRYDSSFDLRMLYKWFPCGMAHCAVLASWLFLENFFQNAGWKYFE